MRSCITATDCLLGVSMRCDIFDLQANHITASKFAVNCKVEESQVTDPLFKLLRRQDGRDVFELERRLLSGQFPLIPGDFIGLRFFE